MTNNPWITLHAKAAVLTIAVVCGCSDGHSSTQAAAAPAASEETAFPYLTLPAELRPIDDAGFRRLVQSLSLTRLQQMRLAPIVRVEQHARRSVARSASDSEAAQARAGLTEQTSRSLRGLLSPEQIQAVQRYLEVTP